MSRSAQSEGIWAWDCVLNEPVLVLPFVLALLGDNPMQSEFACHIGLQAKFFCRNCWCKGRDVPGEREAAGDAEAHQDEAASASSNQSHNSAGVSNSSDGQASDDASASEVGTDTAGQTAQKRKPGRGKKALESMGAMVTRVTAFLKVCMHVCMADLRQLTLINHSQECRAIKERRRTNCDRTLPAPQSLTPSRRYPASVPSLVLKIPFSSLSSTGSSRHTRTSRGTARSKLRSQRLSKSCPHIPRTRYGVSKVSKTLGYISFEQSQHCVDL